MTNSVTNRQMFFILILTLTSYTSINFPKIIAEAAGRSGWMLILAAGLVFGLAAAMIAMLNNRFQGKVMFDYSEEIAGKFFSRAIAIYYLLYFILVAVYLKIELVDFLTSNFLPHTSPNVMLAVSVGLYALVSFRGITNVARLFELYGALFLFTTIGICAVMLSQGMIYNILPFYNPNEVKQFAQAIPQVAFPFGGIEMLLIIPFSKNNKKAPILAFLTLVFIGFFYMLIVESTICILGINNTILYSDSFIEAIKIVTLPVIERTDIFYLTIGLTSLFSGMIMVFLAILEYACRLFPKPQRAVMTLIVAGIVYALCVVGLNIKNFRKIMEATAPYTVTVSAILLPAVLFIVSKIKDRRGRAS